MDVEKIKKALECCQVNTESGCNECPYYNATKSGESDCASKMCADALALITQLFGKTEIFRKDTNK